jgi:hypothetical protein
MEPETEYDPESGVEVEICRTCEELTVDLRNQAAALRHFDDRQAHHGEYAYEALRKELIRARDWALEELAYHQRLHSRDSNEEEK